MAQTKVAGAARYRFGIGEWFGRLFTELTPAERLEYLEFRKINIKKRPPPRCPFRSSPSREVACSKGDGVCTLRVYKEDMTTRVVTPEGLTAKDSRLRTTCPE